MNKLILLAPFLLLMLLGIAGATTPSAIPSGIQYYVPINITNSQSTATPAPFQQMINITESSFSNYIAYNGNLANFEIFNGTGVCEVYRDIILNARRICGTREVLFSKV